MGATVDDETNGQPGGNADGDDTTDVPDDEDGVTIPVLTAGAAANVTVNITNTTGSAATLYGFIDFNGNGDFLDAGEAVTAPVPNGTTGNIVLPFNVPASGNATTTYARFRLSTQTSLTANGAATDGEVEDYQVAISAVAIDRGDLPDAGVGTGAGNYETLLASGGPSHPIVPGLQLGATIDGEADGQPNITATGDDAALSDDEDGVTVADLSLVTGAPANVRVRATNTTGNVATLYGFIDFNGDGDFDDISESVSLPVPDGSSNVEFTLAFGTVPAGSATATYARFRLSTQTSLTANGAATDGEVEDYPVAISVPLSLGNLVWNDLDNSSTLNGSEAGIDGVTVELYQDSNGDGVPDGAPIATTPTAGGFYRFDNLPAGTYIVGIPAINFQPGNPLANFFSSTGPGQEPNPEGSGNNNDNGLDNPNPALAGILSGPVTLSVGGEPINDEVTGEPIGGAPNPNSNLTVDFGFFQPAPNTLSIGNRIWIDTDNSGTLNGSEVGVGTVRVNLVQIIGGVRTVVATTTTDGSGYYIFPNLLPGDYIVQVDPSNFQPGAPLQGSTSSTGAGQEADPNLNGESNDNGIDVPNPATTGVESGIITLQLGTEPTSETDTGSGTGGAANADSNLTIDFGFSPPIVVPPPPPPPGATAPPGPSILDPAIVKLGNPAFAQPGENVVFTITVSNPNGVALANVGFTDNVPSQLIVLSASATAGNVTVSGQTVTFTITPLPANSSVDVTVRTRVRPDVVPPFTIENFATLNGPFTGTARAVIASSIDQVVDELPATGETPWWRLPVLIGAALVLAAGAYALTRRLR
jgi:uncharacterized repeat protein (TIGR01451 family)